jgi:hypothetical protein
MGETTHTFHFYVNGYPNTVEVRDGAYYAKRGYGEYAQVGIVEGEPTQQAAEQAWLKAYPGHPDYPCAITDGPLPGVSGT